MLDVFIIFYPLVVPSFHKRNTYHQHLSSGKMLSTVSLSFLKLPANFLPNFLAIQLP